MATQDMILPELRPRTYHAPVPRRYEETRPVIVQDFSHRRILDLGNDFHQHLTKQFDAERDQAIKVAEKSIWSEARTQQEVAVDSACYKQRQEHEKAVKKLKKIHERNMKEELIKLSSQMDRTHDEEIAQVKNYAELKEQESVKKTEQLWQEKMLQAVEAARSDEFQKAEQRAALASKQHEINQEKLQRHMTKEKDMALTNQAAQLEKEKVVAIATVREEEQVSANTKMEHIKDLFEKQVRILHYKIKALQGDLNLSKQDNQNICRQRVKIQQELRETRHEFQRFIDTVHPFNRNQAEYIIPPIRSFSDSE